MTRYMLDTNICIYLLKHQPPEVEERFAACYYGDVVMSSITLAELWHGVAASGERQPQNRAALLDLLVDIPVLPFHEAQAERYGELRHASGKRKAALDHLIAAHALSEGCILVTNNVQDFQNLPGLQIENWVNG